MIIVLVDNWSLQGEMRAPIEFQMILGMDKIGEKYSQ